MKKFEILKSGKTVFFEEGVFPITTDSLFLADFIKLKSRSKVADLGAGTGVLSFSLDEKVESCLLIDNNEKAVELINEAISSNNLNNYSALLADVKSLDSSLFGLFDAVIMNPPYFKGKGFLPEKDFLKSARHGEIEDFIVAASNLLKTKASLFAVFPAGDLFLLSSLFNNNRLFVKRICFVKTKSGRVNTVLIEAKKDAAHGVVYEKDIIV